MCCARSSASSTCSVKNLLPTVIFACPAFRQPERPKTAASRINNKTRLRPLPVGAQHCCAPCPHDFMPIPCPIGGAALRHPLGCSCRDGLLRPSALRRRLTISLSRPAQTPLNKSQKKIGQQSEQTRRDRARQQQPVADQRHPTKNER